MIVDLIAYVYIVESDDDYDHDACVDKSDIICINIDGDHFESDAHHCQKWCEDRGYDLTIVEKIVEFDLKRGV